MGAAGKAWFPVFFIMAAWTYRYGFCASGRGKREGKNSEKNFQKSCSPLSLRGEEYAQCRLKRRQGRRICTVPFKTAPYLFLLKEKEMDLGVTQKWIMTQCFSVNLLLIN
jgi:hypothetical protein